MEILIGTTSDNVRQSALRHIIRLCKIETSTCDIGSIIHKILIKAQLPLWSLSNTDADGSNTKLLAHSIEYFELRCQLTENLTKEKQDRIGINVNRLLSDEFQCLSTYVVSSTSNELRKIDNTLFLGHLKFLGTLLTCENINNEIIEIPLTNLLIDEFLFPASKYIVSSMKSSNKKKEFNNDSTFEPKCSTSESRLAAYNVLVELVRNSQESLRIVVETLIDLHHRFLPEKQNVWEVSVVLFFVCLFV